MSQPVKVWNVTYKQQWLWLLGALALFGSVLVFDLYFEYHNAAERERARLSTQTRVIAENTEHLLRSANLVLESVRDELPGWRKAADRYAGADYLKVLVDAMPGIRFIGVTDANGILRISNLQDLVGRDFSQRAYFQSAKRSPQADVLYVSPPFKSAANVYVLNVTRMISGPRGEFAGVVTASLDPAYFKTLMSSVLYAPDMWDALAHGDGTLFLMVPGRDALHGMNLAQPGSFFSQHRDSGLTTSVLSGTVYSTGEERMMAQQTIRLDTLRMDHPLVIASSRDLDAIFAPWRGIVLMQAGMFVLFSVLASMGLYVYQRRNLTLERQAAAAKELVEHFRVALDHMPTYIYMKDRQRRYTYANRATLELFGCSAEALLGSADAKFFPPEAVARIHEIDTRVLEHGEDTSEEVVVPEEGGSKRIYWEIKTPIYEDEGRTRIWGLCGVSTDITEREAMKEQFEHQAHEDYLTGLFNRRYFMEQGQSELARAQRYGNALSMLMLDIDHFKVINDTHGHKAGDAVLQKLAVILCETLRTVDIVGRIGGEEFAILLPETGIERAAEVAERLREKVADTDVVLEAGLPLRFTVSIGVATLQGKDSNIDILLNQSDKALYLAKEGGRNKVCVA